MFVVRYHRLLQRIRIVMKQEIGILSTNNTDDIYKDMQAIIEQTRNYAYQAVNTAMVQRNWLLGKVLPTKNCKARIEPNMAKK